MGNDYGSGSAVLEANGAMQVFYDQILDIDQSRAGDPALVCLIDLPHDCPPGDDRGKVYGVANLRTLGAWSGTRRRTPLRRRLGRRRRGGLGLAQARRADMPPFPPANPIVPYSRGLARPHEVAGGVAARVRVDAAVAAIAPLTLAGRVGADAYSLWA